jgi:AGZA family xanthine/uracil permease-like MFS transporter
MVGAANKNFRLPLWVPGDWNAFFGLGINSLTNLLVLSGLLLGVVQMPPAVVFGRIVPAVGVMLVISNLYYFFMARRLAFKTGRTDVTAMPAGPSVPHMFIVVLVIMLPVKIQTGDPVLAWEVGLAWAFIEGLINVSGAFIAPYIRKLTPRAALLGTLAGVSIAFIALRPFEQIFMTPYIGLLGLAIVFGGWFAGVKFPFRLPAGLVTIIVGTVIAWASGVMNFSALQTALSEIQPGLPLPAIDHLIRGFSNIAPLLVTAIPFGIYDFIEAMDNVESAAAAGDDYSVREVILVDGLGSIAGTLLGSCFPNAVYIGHPGWKAVGGRSGYSLATGILVVIVSLLGLIPVLLSIIPLVAILPILLYIGALIGAQAFQATPRQHAPAIVLALIPHIASWGQGQIDGVLTSARLTVEQVGLANLENNGVLYKGMATLGGGAILAGLIIGAIAVFLIDHKPKMAAAYALAGAILSYFGFIHGPQVGIGVSPAVALGYLLMAALCFSFSYLPVENLHPIEEEGTIIRSNDAALIKESSPVKPTESTQ